MSDPHAATDVVIMAARGRDRRQRVWRALWVGSFAQRRQGPRRNGEHGLGHHDLHHPQWLAVSLIILLLCLADGLLTTALITAGATELNPAMQPLVTGSGQAFALWKVGLTGAGLVGLVIAARSRMFGRWPVWPLPYCALALYVVLISYEFWLVKRLGLELLPA